MTAISSARAFAIRTATVADTAVILQLINELAEYERAPNEVVASEAGLQESLFGAHPAAEVLLGEEAREPVCFALFFHNFSTWMGRRGLYLEDLFVRPEARGKGYGRALLVRLAEIARERDCGRMEWAVLDWNEPAIRFYRKLGAKPNDDWTIFRLTRQGISQLAEGEFADAPAPEDARISPT
ncbi:MAG TPA: GNAT family N-acetyltransferase [Chthoniobacterales bacterium]